MKKFRYIIAILLVGLIFSIGLYVGDNLEISRMEKQKEYSNSVKTTIAVVNLDKGAVNGREKINYASAIIDTLDNEYVLVSLQASKAGFDSGNYGAVFTFPADFSSKVLSINDLSPEKTQIKFIVNENLPEEKYITTYSKLLDLEMQISQSISYMYISSIYNELHIAQSEVDKIFQNDSDDMLALETLQLNDYREQINFSGIPDVPLNLSQVNLTPYVNSMSSIAGKIDTLYRNDYNSATTAYGDMRDELAAAMKTITKGVNELSGAVTTWNKANNQFLTDLKTYSQDVSEWRGAFDTWKAQSEILAGQANTFISDVNSWSIQVNTWANDMSVWSDDLSIYRGHLATYKTALDTYGGAYYGGSYIDALNGWKNDANAAVGDLEIWVNDVEKFGTELRSQSAEHLGTINNYNSNVSSIAQYYQDLNAWYNELYDYAHGPMIEPVPEFSTSAVLPGSIDTIPLQFTSQTCPEQPSSWSNLSGVPDAPTQPTFGGSDLPTIPGTMPNYGGSLVPSFALPAYPVLNTTPPSGRPLDLITVPSDLVGALTEYTSTTSKYSPANYLSDDLAKKVEACKRNFSTLLSTVDSKYKQEQVKNIDVLHAAKDSYEDYLMKMKINVNNVHNTEQENLSNAVDAFATVKTNTSAENIGLLESFSDKMPNSRIDSVLNKEVVEFTVSPIQSVNLNLRTSVSANEQSRQKQINILRWIILSLLIAIATLFIIIMIKYLIDKKNVVNSA